MWRLEDAVEGIKGPLDYGYMKVLRFVLRIISGWPGKALGEKILILEGPHHAYYNTILSIVYLALGIIYLKANTYRLTFLEAGHLVLVLLLTGLSTSRAFTLCLSKKYEDTAIMFVKKIHLFYFKDRSEYSMKIHVYVHKMSHYFSIYIIFMLCVTVALFSFMPTYNNYRAGKFANFADLDENTFYEHSVYIVYPFDADHHFKGYVVATIVGWYGAILCGSSIVMFDLFLCLMIFNLWGHFKILIWNLENFPKPASTVDVENGMYGEDGMINGIIPGSEMYSKSESEVVTIKLKECIQYHALIFDFTDRMSGAFGFCLFVYYSFHQISGCLMLLECSVMTTEVLFRYLPLTIIIFGELILLSIIFETLGSMSERLRDAVYNMPWEYMDTKNRKTMLIFLIRVQEPIHVKAGGVVNVGVTTMAAILKTSFSYFAFLRTV